MDVNIWVDNFVLRNTYMNTRDCNNRRGSEDLIINEVEKSLAL